MFKVNQIPLNNTDILWLIRNAQRRYWKSRIVRDPHRIANLYL